MTSNPAAAQIAAARSGEVLRVAGELHQSHAQRMEEVGFADLPYGPAAPEPEYDPDSAIPVCLHDVARAQGEPQEVANPTGDPSVLQDIRGGGLEVVGVVRDRAVACRRSLPRSVRRWCSSCPGCPASAARRRPPPRDAVFLDLFAGLRQSSLFIPGCTREDGATRPVPRCRKDRILKNIHRSGIVWLAQLR